MDPIWYSHGYLGKCFTFLILVIQLLSGHSTWQPSGGRLVLCILSAFFVFHYILMCADRKIHRGKFWKYLKKRERKRIVYTDEWWKVNANLISLPFHSACSIENFSKGPFFWISKNKQSLCVARIDLWKF